VYDNHSDVGLAKEIAQHATGVATLARMMQALADAQLSDQVTFAMPAAGKEYQAQPIVSATGEGSPSGVGLG
jgi:hypothetical protein